MSSQYFPFRNNQLGKLILFYFLYYFRGLMLLKFFWWTIENVFEGSICWLHWQGMQRRNLLRSRSPESETSDSLDVALTKPDDEQLFYTASVHFLRKRLEEKKVHKTSNPTEATQSCCNLSKPTTSACYPVLIKEPPHLESSSRIVEEPSLSMQQVLPFPKSRRDSFFARLKNTFRKYMRPDNDVTVPSTEEPDARHISNFKFPRCSRLSNPHSSCLVEISEERSSEIIKVSKSSKRDLVDERKSVPNR